MSWPDPASSDGRVRGLTVAIGNFDGVHLGHRLLLERAKAIGAPLAVLTFEPHPRTFLMPDTMPFRLTSAESKEKALIEAGADRVIPLTFDAALASMPAERFVREILVDRLGVGTVVIGHDYRFGRDRGGDGDLLRALGSELGFRVISVPPFADRAGNRHSSSLIRAHLADGDVREAARSLGRRWTVAGIARIVPGCGATLPFGEYLRPALGRYGVLVQRAREAAVAGIAVVGGEAETLLLPAIRTSGPMTVVFERLLGRALPEPAQRMWGADNFSPCI